MLRINTLNPKMKSKVLGQLYICSFTTLSACQVTQLSSKETILMIISQITAVGSTHSFFYQCDYKKFCY